jgi:hypothetical protein
MTGYLSLPTAGGDLRQVAAVVNRLNQGKLNCSGTVILAAGQSTTVVDDSRAGPDSFVGLAPLTADGASEIAGGALYVQSRGRGRFVLAHANSGSSDRIFAYLIIG